MSRNDAKNSLTGYLNGRIWTLLSSSARATGTVVLVYRRPPYLSVSQPLVVSPSPRTMNRVEVADGTKRRIAGALHESAAIWTSRCWTSKGKSENSICRGRRARAVVHRGPPSQPSRPRIPARTSELNGREVGRLDRDEPGDGAPPLRRFGFDPVRCGPARIEAACACCRHLVSL